MVRHEPMALQSFEKAAHILLRFIQGLVAPNLYNGEPSGPHRNHMENAWDIEVALEFHEGILATPTLIIRIL